MSAFQIIILGVIIWIFGGVLRKHRQKIISSREMFFWGLLWVLAGLLIIWPGTTSFLASQLGVGRGVDLVLYLAVILNFFLVFRLYLRIDRIEKNLTEIVREIALMNQISKDE